MRPPTVAEAVAHILQAVTDKYRRECIRYWRERYGDGFAEQVRKTALAKLKK